MNKPPPEHIEHIVNEMRSDKEDIILLCEKLIATHGDRSTVLAALYTVVAHYAFEVGQAPIRAFMALKISLDLEAEKRADQARTKGG